MEYQKFVRFEEFVKYDGTNWSDIETDMGSGYTITDLGGGSYLIEDAVHDPIQVNPGDWYRKGGGFESASNFQDQFVSVSLGTP